MAKLLDAGEKTVVVVCYIHEVAHPAITDGDIQHKQASGKTKGLFIQTMRNELMILNYVALVTFAIEGGTTDRFSSSVNFYYKEAIIFLSIIGIFKTKQSIRDEVDGFVVDRSREAKGGIRSFQYHVSRDIVDGICLKCCKFDR